MVGGLFTMTKDTARPCCCCATAARDVSKGVIDTEASQKANSVTTAASSEYFRSVVLRGVNVASYKFALAKSFRALPPGAHGAFDIDDSLATETLNFLGGPLKSPTSERVLATVLFTDIVGSHRTAEQPRRFAVAASTRTDGAHRSPHRCDGRRRRSADQPGRCAIYRRGRVCASNACGNHRLKGLPEDAEVFRVTTPMDVSLIRASSPLSS